MTESHASLTPAVVKGAVWVLAGKAVGWLLYLVQVVVLARLLAPEDFGLFAIVLLAIMVLQTFTNTGFGTAIIQRQDLTREHLDTAWTVGVVRSFALAAILLVLAPVAAAFFKAPQVVWLLRVMSVSVFLQGFTNVGVLCFYRELKFHKVFVYEALPATIGLVVGVAAAFRLRSVWALVYAGVAQTVTAVVLSYLIHPYRPAFRISVARGRELSGFGIWVYASGAVIFLCNQGDNAFVGKALGLAALGIYRIAFVFANSVSTEVTHALSPMLFPAYAKIRGDSERLKSAYLRSLEHILLIAVPLAALIGLFGGEIVRWTVGTKWEGAIPLLPVLAGQALIRAVVSTGGALYLAVGKPQYDFWQNVLRLGILAIAIYPLARALGLWGVCVAVLLSYAALLPVWVLYARRLLTIPSWRLASAFVQPAAAAALLVAPAWLAAELLGRSTVPLVLGLVLGSVLSLCYVLVRRGAEWKAVIRSVRS